MVVSNVCVSIIMTNEIIMARNITFVGLLKFVRLCGPNYLYCSYQARTHTLCLHLCSKTITNNQWRHCCCCLVPLPPGLHPQTIPSDIPTSPSPTQFMQARCKWVAQVHSVSAHADPGKAPTLAVSVNVVGLSWLLLCFSCCCNCLGCCGCCICCCFTKQPSITSSTSQVLQAKDFSFFKTTINLIGQCALCWWAEAANCHLLYTNQWQAQGLRLSGCKGTKSFVVLSSVAIRTHYICVWVCASTSIYVE